MKYNRILPLLIPIFVFILLEIFYFKENLIYVAMLFVLLSFFFISRQFSIASGYKEKFWDIMILPSIFTISLVSFAILIPRSLFTHVLFVVNIIFLYLYFREIYYYLFAANHYKKNSLQNLSAYGNFASFYFLSSAIYGIQVYINAPVWLLMSLVLLATFLIVKQVIWANGINEKRGLFYILLSGLVISEIAWSISFLTLSYYILGLILSVTYYTIIGLLRFYLLGSLNKQLVKMYVIFGVFSIIIVLLTSRWV